MTAAPTRIFVARQGSELLIRVSGRGTSHACPALRQFVEQCLAEGADTVRIYLAECAHLDSTFVGTLLFLVKQPALGRSQRVQLCAPSAECRRVLKQMAVVGLFTVCESDESVTDQPWRELNCDFDHNNVWQFKQNVVEAHAELAAVPGPLSDCFRAIAEAGREELKSGGRAESNTDRGRGPPFGV